jgi:AcrR family transcriptional regulator
VLAAAYHARLDLTGLPPAAAAAARSSVCGGLAEAGRLRSASLGHSVRAAFVHGIDISLLVPAGIAAVGVILTLAFPAQVRSARAIRATEERGRTCRRALTRRRPALRERKKAQTCAAIQTHALRLFREQGYDARTIEQIIHAADVSETTFFRYFPTKEDLVLQDGYDPLIVAAYQAQPPDLPPIPAVRAAFRALFAQMSAEQQAEQRERVTLVLSVAKLRAAMLDQFCKAMQLLAGPMAERAGRSPDDVAVRTVAGAVVGTLMAVLAAMAGDPGADLAPLIDAAMAHLEAGLSL